MIWHLATDARITGRKGNRPLPHHIRRHRQANKNLQKVQTAEEQVLLEQEEEFLAEISFEERARSRHVIIGRPPCIWTISPNQDATMAKMPFSTCWGGGEAQQKIKEGWCERISCFIEGVLLCVLRFLSENIYSQEWRKIGIKTRRHSLHGHVAPKIIRERKGPSRRVIEKCEPHERSPCAPRFEERSHEEPSKQESWAHKAAWDLATNIHKFKNKNRASFCRPVEIRGIPAPISKSPEEREFVVDSGASMHMLSRKRFELRRTGRSYSKVWSSREQSLYAKIWRPDTGGNLATRTMGFGEKTSIISKEMTRPRSSRLPKLGQCRNMLSKTTWTDQNWKPFKNRGNHNGSTGQRKSANKRESTGIRSRSWAFRDSAHTRWHACRLDIGQTLRRER